MHLWSVHCADVVYCNGKELIDVTGYSGDNSTCLQLECNDLQLETRPES